MRDRESTFSDESVIALLRDRFVPVAIDSHDYRSSRDAQGRFFQGVAFKALLNPANKDGGRSYQGHYVIHPSGKLLAAHNRRGVKALRGLLSRALAEHRVVEAGSPASAPTAELPRRDPRFDRSPPKGALVLKVYARVRAEQSDQPRRGEFARWNEGRTGLDHLWVLPAELKALAPKRLSPGASYPVPRALARRLARFHVVDTVRGESPKYGADEVKRADLVLTVRSVSSEGEVLLDLSGDLAMEAAGTYPRTFKGQVRGQLIYELGARRFRSFDLFASGTSTGTGRWNPGAPRGDYTLDVGVELPPKGSLRPVAPHAARDRRGYLKP